MSEVKQPDPGPHPQPHPDASMVPITIDGKVFSVHRGRILVSDLKKLANIPAAYELVEVIDKKLKPLPDDGFTIIQGDERFVSHPRDGQSS